MPKAFDLTMRIISSLLGGAVFCLGVVWIMQGLNEGFRVAPMVGDHQWAYFGILLLILGVCQMIWTNNRAKGL